MPNSMTIVNQNYTGSIPAPTNMTGGISVASAVLVLSTVKVVFIRHLVLVAPASHSDRGLNVLMFSITRKTNNT
jgi:hypothetical protein